MLSRLHALALLALALIAASPAVARDELRGPRPERLADHELPHLAFIGFQWIEACDEKNCNFL